MKLQIKNRAKIFICISAGVMLVALLMTVFGYGVNLGIDFAGGLNIEYNMNGTFSQADVETALKNQGLTDFKVSTTGDAGTTSRRTAGRRARSGRVGRRGRWPVRRRGRS